MNQQMRTGMDAVSQIGDRRGTLERCREGKEEAVHVAPPGLSLQESMEDVPLAERLAARMKAAKATRES